MLQLYGVNAIWSCYMYYTNAELFQSNSSAYLLYNDAPPVLVYKNNSGHSKGTMRTILHLRSRCFKDLDVSTFHVGVIIFLRIIVPCLAVLTEGRPCTKITTDKCFWLRLTFLNNHWISKFISAWDQIAINKSEAFLLFILELTVDYHRNGHQVTQ